MKNEINSIENELQDFKQQNTSMQQTTIAQNEQIKKLQNEQEQLMHQISHEKTQAHEIKKENNKLQRQLTEFTKQNTSNLQIVKDKE